MWLYLFVLNILCCGGPLNSVWASRTKFFWWDIAHFGPNPYLRVGSTRNPSFRAQIEILTQILRSKSIISPLSRILRYFWYRLCKLRLTFQNVIRGWKVVLTWAAKSIWARRMSWLKLTFWNVSFEWKSSKSNDAICDLDPSDIDLVQNFQCLTKKSFVLDAQTELGGPPQHKMFRINRYNHIPGV